MLLVINLERERVVLHWALVLKISYRSGGMGWGFTSDKHIQALKSNSNIEDNSN